MTRQREEGGIGRLWRRAKPLLWNPQRWVMALRRNALLKTLSVVAAFCLWLFVNAGARDTEVALQVPLRLLNIPSHLMILGPRIDFIDVRVSGPRTILGGIDRDRLAIPLDLRGVRAGPAVFRVGADSIDVPRGVRVTLINPSRITIELVRIGRKVVPVRVELDGEVPDGLTVSVTKVVPASVEVEGPAPDVADISFVQAEPVPITGTEPGTLQVEVTLISPEEYITLKPPRIAVTLTLADEIVTRRLERPLEVRNAAYDFTFAPQSVQVTLRGPKRILDAVDPSSVAVYVDVAGESVGVSALAITVDAPPQTEVAGVEPAEARVELKAAAAPAGEGEAAPGP